MGKPALYNQFSQVEFLWELGNRLHQQNKILMGNGINEQRAFNAFALDVFGAELGFATVINQEERLAFYRAVGYQKPVVGLVYSGWENEADVIKFWKNALLYGFFATGGQKEVNEIVYQNRYAPLLIQLAQAGWQPVTGVRANDRDVRMERYGSADNFYLVIYNRSTVDKTIELEFDNQVLRRPVDGLAISILDETELSVKDKLHLNADALLILHFKE